MGEQQMKTLAEEVVELLKVDELTVTTAESCTGGLVAARLVDVPGVSEVFKQGFITYSNKAKEKASECKEDNSEGIWGSQRKDRPGDGQGRYSGKWRGRCDRYDRYRRTGRRNGREAGGPCIYRRICTGTDVCGRAPF